MQITDHGRIFSLLKEPDTTSRSGSTVGPPHLVVVKCADNRPGMNLSLFKESDTFIAVVWSNTGSPVG